MPRAREREEALGRDSAEAEDLLHKARQNDYLLQQLVQTTEDRSAVEDAHSEIYQTLFYEETGIS